MAWTYSDWPVKSTAALQLSQLNLHIQEVADKIGNERSADGYSQGSGSLTTYLSALMTSRERLQATPGVSGTGCTSNIRMSRRGAL
jgi:hypothetical protein